MATPHRYAQKNNLDISNEELQGAVHLATLKQSNSKEEDDLQTRLKYAQYESARLFLPLRHSDAELFISSFCTAGFNLLLAKLTLMHRCGIFSCHIGDLLTDANVQTILAKFLLPFDEIPQSAMPIYYKYPTFPRFHDALKKPADIRALANATQRRNLCEVMLEDALNDMHVTNAVCVTYNSRINEDSSLRCEEMARFYIVPTPEFHYAIMRVLVHFLLPMEIIKGAENSPDDMSMQQFKTTILGGGSQIVAFSVHLKDALLHIQQQTTILWRLIGRGCPENVRASQDCAVNGR